MEAENEKPQGARWQGWLLVACIATAAGLMAIGYWSSPVEKMPVGSPNVSAGNAGDSRAPRPRPTRFRVTQRQSIAMPIPERTLVRLGDITRGRVSVTVAEDGGQPVLAFGRLGRNDTLQFTIGEIAYRLELVELHNLLVGTDYAIFTISSDQRVLTEREKIDRLIAFVEGMKDATFIRNDDTYTPDSAADHLRRKLSHADQSLTAEQFITEIASRSSSSGEAYRVRYEDGREVSVEQVLREELTRLAGAGR